MRLFAIVLAAGRGERMGGPKALLDLPGGPLIAQHVASLVAGGAERVLVVTRPECVSALEVLAMDHVVVIGAETPQPAASLAAALAAHALEQIAIVTPVDAMPANPKTLSALLAAIEGGAEAAVPTFGGRGGHPIVARSEVLAPYRASAAPPPPLRDVLRALGARSVRVPVEDASVLVNLDAPSEVRAHFGVEPRFLPATRAT